MNEQLEGFLKNLEDALMDIPGDERTRAIEYYREYLYDACESGADPAAVLDQVGDVKSIASEIHTEVSISKAREKPGIRNYSNALKNTLRMVTTPFSVLLLIFSVILTGSIVATFFAAAFCTFLAAIASFFAGIYEAAAVSAQFYMERIGAVGFGIMLSGLLMLVTLCFYWLGRRFIRISLWIIDLIRKKNIQYQPGTITRDNGKKKSAKQPIMVFSGLTLLGLILFFVSGLPLRYFAIFNSTKPADVRLESFDYRSDEVSSISVTSAHSYVIISKGTDDSIRLLYEKTDWLDFDLKAEGKTLYFQERSNGRLPFFSLVALHESLSEIRLILPKDYEPAMIRIDSIGGHIRISGADCNMQAETVNGTITFVPDDTANSSIVAKTAHGKVYFGDSPAGNRTENGIEFVFIGKPEKIVELTSTNGDIYLR